MKKILKRHPKKVSRKIKESDIETVLNDSHDLYRICFEPIGNYPRGALAMAHVQIEKDDPLRFFVNKNGEMFINPEIISKKQSYSHLEGCMSFPLQSAKKVSRFNLIEVEYTPAALEGEIDLTNRVIKKFSAMDAAIFQHEIDHFNLNLLY